MLKNIHLIKPHLLLLLLYSFFARIEPSAVPSSPISSEIAAFVEYAPLAPRDAFTSTFDDPTARVPPAPQDATSTASIVSSREITSPSLPLEEWHLVLEENASFLPTQAAAAVLEAFYKGAKTTIAHYTGDNRMLRLLFGELELMFSPLLARVRAYVMREVASVWLEYMLQTVVMGAPATYSGWMVYGPDVRVRVVLRVRQQVGVGGTGMDWRRR